VGRGVLGVGGYGLGGKVLSDGPGGREKPGVYVPVEVIAVVVVVTDGVTTVGAAGGGGGAAGSVVVVAPELMIILPLESTGSMGLSARAGVTVSNIKELINSIAAIVNMIIFEFILHLLNDAMP
jgi:hypothetical protein